MKHVSVSPTDGNGPTQGQINVTFPCNFKNVDYEIWADTSKCGKICASTFKEGAYYKFKGICVRFMNMQENQILMISVIEIQKENLGQPDIFQR